METTVRTYKNSKRMEKDIVRMARDGWSVRDISEHREQAGGSSCGVLVLALLTFGIALLLLLVTRRTVYTVTFERNRNE